MTKGIPVDFSGEHPDDTLSLPEDLRDDFHRKMNSVVAVVYVYSRRIKDNEMSNGIGTGDNEMSNGIGTGVFIDRKGLVLTCAHIFDCYAHPDEFKFLDKDRELRIMVQTHDGRVTEADLVDFDRGKDISLIRLRGQKPTDFGIFRKTAEVGLGKQMIIIHQAGPGFSIESGFVSDSVARPTFNYKAYIDPDLPMLHISKMDPGFGASGGAVFDSSGRIAGILIRAEARYPSSVIICPRLVIAFVKEYKKNGSSMDKRKLVQEKMSSMDRKNKRRWDSGGSSCDRQTHAGGRGKYQ